MSFKLFLDDQWDEPEMFFRHPPEGFIPARSSSEAIELTQKHGVPEFISFDHDLADGDDAMVYIRWLSDNYYDMQIPNYKVHSANPVGKANIIAKMESWRRSQQL